MRPDLHQYSAFGCTIGSEFLLPELPPGPGNPEIVIRRGKVPFTPKKATADEQFMFNSLSGAFHIRGGREIVVEPLEGVDPEALRVVLLGRVMASLLRQRGWLPLHASGVAIGGRAVLFLGSSGAGKSTMAASLHARGHSVVTDDVAAIRVSGGRCELLPAWSRLRLSEESMPVLARPAARMTFQIDKFSVDLASDASPDPLPVAGIYILGFGDGPRSAVVSPLLAAASLSFHSFVKQHRLNSASNQTHLTACAKVAETISVHRLLRPRDMEALPLTAEFVEDRVLHGVLPESAL